MFYSSFFPVFISFKYVPHIAPTDHIVCDKPVGLTNNVLLTLQFEQLKQAVMKTEHSQEFQPSLTRDNPALVHSVHRAHSTVYSLLNSVVY